MSAPYVQALRIEFLEWVDARPRTYDDAMEAWQSNCPRHPVWEDALADRLIRVVGPNVALTQRGRAALGAAG